MILRRLTEHVKDQNWFAVALDFLIVVLGVFVGLQVNNWNEARAAKARRDQITAALITDLRDAAGAQQQFATSIEDGVTAWTAAFEAGEMPPPFFYRIEGSDTAPKTWETLQQMQLTDMFDPATIFDLGFYYSELDGVGVKYIRYVTFVENEILPNLKRDPAVFYAADKSALLPEYAANMERMEDYARESARLRIWANCLVYRLEAKRSFEQTCRRANYVLEGMPAAPEVVP
ncbi:MAG: hypothetical protein RLO80_07755 [Hyphomonas sp.]